MKKTLVLTAVFVVLTALLLSIAINAAGYIGEPDGKSINAAPQEAIRFVNDIYGKTLKKLTGGGKPQDFGLGSWDDIEKLSMTDCFRVHTVDFSYGPVTERTIRGRLKTENEVWLFTFALNGVPKVYISIIKDGDSYSFLELAGYEEYAAIAQMKMVELMGEKAVDSLYYITDAVQTHFLAVCDGKEYVLSANDLSIYDAYSKNAELCSELGVPMEAVDYAIKAHDALLNAKTVKDLPGTESLRAWLDWSKGMGD